MDLKPTSPSSLPPADGDVKPKQDLPPKPKADDAPKVWGMPNSSAPVPPPSKADAKATASSEPFVPPKPVIADFSSTPSEADPPPAVPGIVTPGSAASPATSAPVGSHMPASAASHQDIAGAAAATTGTLLPPPAKSRKKTKVIALVIVLAVLVLGLGSAAAYVGYYLPNKPQNVLGQALINTFSKDTKSVAFEGEVTVEDKKGKALPGTAIFSGASSESGAAEVKAEVDVLVTKVTVDARSVDGKTFYLRVGGLKGLDELLGGSEGAAIYQSLIQQIDNQWFEINESLIKQLSDNSLDTKLSDADRQKLLDAYKVHQFIVVTEALSSQTIKNTECYHYKLGVDKTKLKAFVKAIKEAKIDSLKLDNKAVTEFNKQVDQADLNKVKIDIWISKGDKMIKQVLASGTEDDQTYAVRFTVSDYNKAVKVEKPSGAKSIMELLSPFLETSGTGTDAETLMNDVQGISL